MSDDFASLCVLQSLYSLGLLCIIGYWWPPFPSWNVFFLPSFSSFLPFFFFLPSFFWLAWHWTNLIFFSTLIFSSVALVDSSSRVCPWGAVSYPWVRLLWGWSHISSPASLLMISLCDLNLSQDSQAYLSNCPLDVSTGKYSSHPKLSIFF